MFEYWVVGGIDIGLSGAWVCVSNLQKWLDDGLFIHDF